MAASGWNREVLVRECRESRGRCLHERKSGRYLIEVAWVRQLIACERARKTASGLARCASEYKQVGIV